VLYLVATPIGNLGDISLRALEVLRAVDYVASEDTRKTGLLLKHFDIKKPQIAFHEHNEERAGERIMTLLAAGQSVAVVSDAGTPGVPASDTTATDCPAASRAMMRAPARSSLCSWKAICGFLMSKCFNSRPVLRVSSLAT